MTCSVILFYTVTMLSGATARLEKWVTPDYALHMTLHLTDPATLQEAGIKSVTNIVVKHVEPYDCMKGPKQ